MLSKNHLMWLPTEFGDLSSLEDLRLDDNEVSYREFVQLVSIMGQVNKCLYCCTYRISEND